jgi:hypothetical protein
MSKIIKIAAPATPKVAKKPTTPGLYQVSSMTTSDGASLANQNNKFLMLLSMNYKSKLTLHGD